MHTIIRHSFFFGFAAVVAAASLGCNENKNTDEGGTDASVNPDASSGTVPGARTEPEIFGILDAVNTAEIEQGEIAKDRAAAEPVKQFAQMMIDEHGAAKKRQESLRDQLGQEARDSAKRAELQQKNDDAKDALRNRSGAELDAFYVNGQIQQHEQTLALLDAELIPSARTAQLSTELKTTRESVARHLEMAKALKTDGGVVTTSRKP